MLFASAFTLNSDFISFFFKMKSTRLFTPKICRKLNRFIAFFIKYKAFYSIMSNYGQSKKPALTIESKRAKMTLTAIDFETATAYHPCSVGIVTVENGVIVD